MERRIFNFREKNSIVHCITNYVTVNDLANIILASNSSAIMADDREEVEEIVGIADSLVINIGTLNKRTIESMLRAGKKANDLNIPIVFDPVGVGVSTLRQETSKYILDKIKLSVIKGNASEIKFLYNKEASSSGVDVDIEDIIEENNIDSYIDMAKELSKKYNSIVGISGKIDIITDGEIVYLIRNGNSLMEDITGTGCMLSGLVGALVGKNKDKLLDSTVLAMGMMGIAGDRSKKHIDENNLGTGSFRTSLIDNINLLKPKDIEEEIKIEKR